MKLPEPIQKPNGKWLIQVMVDGERRSKTFDSKEAAIYWASGLKTQMREYQRSPGNMTVGQAIDRYIENGGNFSPSTLAGYKKLRRNTMLDIMDVKLSNLTQDMVQRSVNRMLRDGKSPKYIMSAHGLLSATLKKYYPDFKLQTMLPQKQKKEIRIPTNEEVAALLQAAKGTDSELPIMLAVWLGLRASEISGLTWDCIEGDNLHIKKARVRGDDGKLYLKEPKTYSGNRVIHIPAPVKALFDKTPKNGEFIVDLSPHAIYSRFSRVSEKAGIPHYRLLICATTMHLSWWRMGHRQNTLLNVWATHQITWSKMCIRMLCRAERKKYLMLSRNIYQANCNQNCNQKNKIYSTTTVLWIFKRGSTPSPPPSWELLLAL